MIAGTYLATKHLPSVQVDLVHRTYLSVKATRSQQSSIKHIRSVGGCQHNDTGVALKAVHLCQQLVDGLLPLIIASTHASTSLSAHSINLINEDNAWCLGLCLQAHQDAESSRAAALNK